MSGPFHPLLSRATSWGPKRSFEPPAAFYSLVTVSTVSPSSQLVLQGGRRAARSNDLASTEITSLFVLENLVYTSCLQRVSARPVYLSESLLLPVSLSLPPSSFAGSPLARSRQEGGPHPRAMAVSPNFRKMSRRVASLVDAFVRAPLCPSPARRLSYLGPRRSVPRSCNMILENLPSSFSVIVPILTSCHSEGSRGCRGSVLSMITFPSWCHSGQASPPPPIASREKSGRRDATPACVLPLAPL